jgi:hypothetical protein
MTRRHITFPDNSKKRGALIAGPIAHLKIMEHLHVYSVLFYQDLFTRHLHSPFRTDNSKKRGAKSRIGPAGVGGRGRIGFQGA